MGLACLVLIWIPSGLTWRTCEVQIITLGATPTIGLVELLGTTEIERAGQAAQTCGVHTEHKRVKVIGYNSQAMA
jgi:hypothetical protein